MSIQVFDGQTKGFPDAFCFIECWNNDGKRWPHPGHIKGAHASRLAFKRNAFSRSSPLPIDIDHKLLGLIDVPAVHPIGAERKCHAAFSIDGDESARATEFSHFLEHALGGFLDT